MFKDLPVFTACLIRYVLAQKPDLQVQMCALHVELWWVHREKLTMRMQERCEYLNFSPRDR